MDAEERGEPRAAPRRELRVQASARASRTRSSSARGSSARRRSSGRRSWSPRRRRTTSRSRPGSARRRRVNIVVLPVLFEDQVMARDRARLVRAVQRDAAQRSSTSSSETIGIVLNTILANMRTEELLQQSQALTQELQAQSEELQAQQRRARADEPRARGAGADRCKASEELLQKQQEELQQTNEELEEKAQLLEEQNRGSRSRTARSSGRAALEEKAEQLALTSKYKSRVPREHVARAAHAAQLAADPGEAARRQRRTAT